MLMMPEQTDDFQLNQVSMGDKERVNDNSNYHNETFVLLLVMYLDDRAAMLTNYNDYKNLSGKNIELNIGDIEDALTQDSISRLRFSDSEFEARVAVLMIPRELLMRKSLSIQEEYMIFKRRSESLCPALHNRWY